MQNRGFLEVGEDVIFPVSVTQRNHLGQNVGSHNSGRKAFVISNDHIKVKKVIFVKVGGMYFIKL